MLDTSAISKLVSDVARSQAAPLHVEQVLAESILDSEGNPALRITVVLQPSSVEMLSGDAALDLLVNIQDRLAQSGENRLAIVEYATEADLIGDKEDADDERDQEQDDA